MREIVRQTYQFRCGYCGVHEEDAGAILTIDHYRPQSRFGNHTLENLVYCCPKCNAYKGSYWHEVDPPYIRLLHPRQDDLTAHLREETNGRVVGLTKEGVFFIQRLHLNRPSLIAYRLKRRTEQQLKDELRAVQEREQALLRRIEELDAALRATTAQIEEETS